MAVDGTVTESGFNRLRKCEVRVPVVIDGAGAGTEVIVNLSEAFSNEPQSMIVLPLGCNGTWTKVYDSATPKITVDCSGVTAVFQSKTVEVILVAWDTN